MKTLSIALTGGIGCGKTLISQVFSHLQVPVFNSDKVAKELYLRKDVLKDMQTLFGTEIVAEGVLDRGKLSEIVFNNREKLEQLNSYIHPKVEEEYMVWLKWQTEQNVPYVIMESAIIFEINWEKKFDKVICINTPERLVIQRTMLRDNATKQQIEKRMLNQISTKEKIEKSDYIVNNDDVQLVIPQILKIDNELKNLSNKINTI
ncbi:MAG: dephospho-CoA kinase [Bacteroidales bacterium]|nr:dephospho-CoA kinase [Bacteroidales bacterium]